MPDCTPVDMPAVTADYCAPDINFGQIDKIYLANEGNPLTDWSSLVEWNGRLDNTASTSADIATLHVIGDKPAPEATEIEFSQGRKAYAEKKHTVNVKIDETDATNYTLLLFLEANVGQRVLVWYQAGKYLYGGNSGISALLKLDDVIPESDQELNTFQGNITWEGAHPERITNPLA